MYSKLQVCYGYKAYHRLNLQTMNRNSWWVKEEVLCKCTFSISANYKPYSFLWKKHRLILIQKTHSRRGFLLAQTLHTHVFYFKALHYSCDINIDNCQKKIPSSGFLKLVSLSLTIINFHFQSCVSILVIYVTSFHDFLFKSSMQRQWQRKKLFYTIMTFALKKAHNT